MKNPEGMRKAETLTTLRKSINAAKLKFDPIVNMIFIFIKKSKLVTPYGSIQSPGPGHR